MAYSAIGSVRGHCGHWHQTVAAAEACRQADADGCGRQGGYSDMEVCRSNGGPLNAAEQAELETAGQEAFERRFASVWEGGA